MVRPTLPRDPLNRPINAKLNEYLQARAIVQRAFPKLMEAAVKQALDGDSTLLARLLPHLETQPTPLPGISATADPAQIASDVARWAACGGISVQTGRKLIALLNESQAFVKRSQIVDALVASYESANQEVPDRVRAMTEGVL